MLSGEVDPECLGETLLYKKGLFSNNFGPHKVKVLNIYTQIP